MPYRFVDEDIQQEIPMKGNFRFVEEEKPERSNVQKAGRIGAQFGLGLAESAALPYELAVAPLASKEVQNVEYRANVGEDIERLLEQKSMGQWDEQDESLLKHLQEQIQDPEKSGEFVKTADLGIRGLAEKATGLDLHPEGIAEHAANWSAFIKNPSKIAQAGKEGVKSIIKAIAPTGREAVKGLGAGTALSLAEEGEYGPAGIIAATIVGDVIGGKAADLVKQGKKLVTAPKKALAEGAAAFTNKEKLALQKEIINDFREAGIQADLGTITDSNLFKLTQSRLAQSGLTGKSREQFTDQIKNEYKALAEGLGEAKFATTHEAGEVAKEGIKKIRDADLAQTRELYQNANNALKEGARVDAIKVGKSIKKLKDEIKPGRVKSSEQNAVLNIIENLEKDLFTPEGKNKFADVKSLMNNKIALNDIINYEVQGGAKQLLKGIVAELDRAIISHGRENIPFARNYVNANKKFSQHAKTFRNKNVNQLLNAADPSQIMNKMNSVQGIKDLDKVLGKTAEGKEIFDNLKRLKFDKTIGDHLVDSVSQQIKLGTFSKLLEKGKNREIIKEIMGSQNFKRLERLQKNAGRLADAAQKYYNSSKSASTAIDAAVIATGIKDIANIFMGNPWPLMKTGAGILGARGLNTLINDPEFLKLVEEFILISEKESPEMILQAGERLRPYILSVNQQNKES